MPDAAEPAMKCPISVIVPVKNEAANLRRCLPALAWADEVFVVDSGSTDATALVAEEHGAKVVPFRFNGTYPKKKNWALENLPFRHEWVLIVDADEVVPPALAVEIARRTSADEADGFYLNSRYYFLGRRIKHCGYSECWNLRLFKHRLGRYERMPVRPGAATGDNEAHEHVELRGRARRLAHQLDHHAYPTIAAWVEKHDRYAAWEAEMYERFLVEPVPRSIGAGKRFKRRLKKVYLRMPMRPLIRFLYAYVARLGFLDGMPGLVFCVLLSFYDFLCWAKLYECRLEEGAAAPWPLRGPWWRRGRRGPRAEGRAESRRQRAESRRQKAEGRRQKAEGRRRGRRQRANGGASKATFRVQGPERQARFLCRLPTSLCWLPVSFCPLFFAFCSLFFVLCSSISALCLPTTAHRAVRRGSAEGSGSARIRR